MNINLGKIDLKQQKELIFIIVVVLVTLFFGKKTWDSQKRNSSTINNKIKSSQEKINLANEINKLSKETERFQDVGWQTKESVFVMGKINELASLHGIEIATFDPGGLKDSNNYITLSMSLNVGADYFDLSRFLSAIEDLETLTKITNLQIMPQGAIGSEEGGPMVKAKVSVIAFIFKK